MRDEFYRARKKKLWDMYWKDNDGSDIFRPNGFEGILKKFIISFSA
jgi:hypothetical protein